MRRRTFLPLAAGAALAGCLGLRDRPGAGTPVPGAPSTGTPPDVEAPTEGLVSGNADFGLALLDRLADHEPDSNRFLSPYSVGVALAMTYAGARATTREEMAATMRFAPTGEDLHESVAALRSDLPLTDTSGTPTPTPTPPSETPTGQEGAPFRLLGANALWGQVEYPFRQAFLDALSRYYGAGLGRVDFGEHPDRARGRINAWVEDHTEGEIADLFPEGTITASTRLVLANAVYFRANWADTFREEATEPAPFIALDGSTSEVPTMTESVEAPYASVDGDQVVRLPYAGGDTEMVLLLPAPGTFRSFERSLDAARLDELVAATEQREGTVALPRFSFRSTLSLPEQLRAMGMETAFTGAADFTGMAEGSAGERLALDDVRHEATITVDEQGTEAAAATGVEVVAISAPADPFDVRFDRPFLFAVRHRPTGAVLFLGRLVDAGAAQG
jgi:serpin B